MKTFILSDESINCYGYRVLTDGIDLEQFTKNPVMLYSHNSELLPIGTWDNVRKENGQLLAEANFDNDDEFAMQIAEKVEKGIIRCCSIGFEIVALSDDPVLMLPGQHYATVTQSKLLECSVCAIGANRNAMSLSHNTDTTLKMGDVLHLSLELTNIDNMKNKTPNTATLETQVQELSNTNATLSQQRDELQTKVAELTAQVTTLQQQIEQKHQTEISTLVDKAIADGRLTTTEKDVWTALLSADFDNASKALAKLKAPTSLSQMLSKNTAITTNLAEEWDKIDRSGKLAQLKATDPTRFAELYKARFGTEYIEK